MRDGRKGGMRDQLSGDESSQASRESVRRASKFCEKLPKRHYGRYEYPDAKGDVPLCVQRYEKDGTKFFVQYTPIQAENGKIGWLKSLQIDGPRPLYRLLPCSSATESARSWSSRVRSASRQSSTIPPRRFQSLGLVEQRTGRRQTGRHSTVDL